MAGQENVKTRNERCTCRSGRDHDGSEFGPCAYCEERQWLAMRSRAESAKQPALGPWTVVTLKDDAHRVETIAGVPVANVPVMDRSDHHANNAARAEANARLIAAAPELYAALEPIANMCRVLESRSRMTFGKIVDDREVLCESSGEVAAAVLRMGDFRRAAAAFAKARGGA